MCLSRNAPIGPTLQKVLTELATLTETFSNDLIVNIIDRFKNHLDISEVLAEVQYWERRLETCGAHNIPNRNLLVSQEFNCYT